MFPEIRGAVKDFLSGFGGDTIALDLKNTTRVDAAFDTVNASWYARNGYPGIYSVLSGGGGPAWSGEQVSLKSALQHSVVWACNRLICESVAFMPLDMLRKRSDGMESAANHPMSAALQDEPNPEMTATTFRETLTSHCLLQGNAYAQIYRRSGTGVANELRLLQPGQVTPDHEKGGKKRLVYIVKDGNDPERSFTVAAGVPQDLLHLRGLGDNGVVGYSVFEMARQSFGTAIAAERHAARFYANGGRVPYILKSAQKFRSDEEFLKFRNQWEQTYSEPHRAPILENGMQYEQIGLNAVDAQMLETRLFDIHEICRWFLVSPHLVGDLSRATFSNIEQLAMEFVKLTLTVWLNRWEKELKRCVLTSDEKAAGLFFKHNVNALQRGDFLSRMSGYSTMLQNGIASVNEVRDLEDWNPIDGGDSHHIQLNMQTLPGGEPLTSQATNNQLIRIDKQKGNR